MDVHDFSPSAREQTNRRSRTGRASPTIAAVVSQHAEDGASLRHARSVLVRAPHVKVHHLQRLDDRIAAHLDGLVVASSDGWKFAVAELGSPGAGQVFAATVLAILDYKAAALDRLFTLAEAGAPANRGLVSAFGWVSAESLRGIVAELLADKSAFRRGVGLATCAMHRVDAGKALRVAMTDHDPSLRSRAYRAAGELGRLDMISECRSVNDNGADCCFQRDRAGLLLGERNASIAGLRSIAMSFAPRHVDALRLLLKLTANHQSRALLQPLARDATRVRTLIQSVGIAGDPYYVPWLMKQIGDPKLARLAGESFCLITGVDLAYLHFESKPPEGVDFGPSDDPADDNVAMDEDDGLPWPDPVKIAAWWGANKSRFISGRRYFMGEEPSWSHCLQVLKDGFQRQRIAAAEYLCLIRPGTPLFPTAAPAWRQKRWLDGMA